MNNSGFFSCGVGVGTLVAGTLVAGALGIGLFEAERDPILEEATVAESLDAESLVMAGDEAEANSTARFPVPAEAVSSLGMKRQEGSLAALQQAEIQRLQVALEDAMLRAERNGALARDLRKALKTLRVEGLARRSRHEEELAEQRAEVARRTEDLELAAKETYNLLERFFDGQRTPEHATLVSGYFTTSAPEEFKGKLVDALLENNIDVLAALSPGAVPNGVGGAVGEVGTPGNEATSHRIIPVSIDDEAKPTRALDANGGVGKP